jgi:hypothetical protein
MDAPESAHRVAGQLQKKPKAENDQKQNTIKNITKHTIKHTIKNTI